MSYDFRVAAIQMNCVLGSVKENHSIASEMIQKSVDMGAKLVVLPELFNTGYRTEQMDYKLAQHIPGETSYWMQELCKKNNIILVASILECGEVQGLIYDTALSVNASGVLNIYRKIHLWDKESLRFTKGQEFPIVNLGFAKLGMQICYEIGFPEGARILSLKGADILAYPSAFGKARLYAWDIATRSRALENGVYIIAANRSGEEKEDTVFAGHSRIVNPKGEVLAEAFKENEVLVADIDLDFVGRQRRELPYLRDLNKTLINKCLCDSIKII